ncbi:hypothetical protein CASFOL_001532 [Castilleja foliolosa]|uniref:Pentatricopeptide repeat-containing protein n=1 Tax=Castilleja foliolosa TaxID=1961234 RepID=A0ABD3ELC4_9LAMI
MVSSYFIPDVVTYSALILGNCKTGKIGRALDLFSHVRSKCWIMDGVAYGEFVECLCEKVKIQEAVGVFCYMGTVPLSSTCNNILRGLYKSGQKNDLFVILSRMIVIGSTFDVETYCVLIRCMSGLNRKGDCVSIFNLLLSEDLVPDSETLACLLSCLAKYSELHLIFPKIDKLVSESEILDSAMFNFLVNGLWREGYKNETSRLLDLMLEKGWVPDASTHALLMGSTASNEVVSSKTEDNFCGKDYISSILEEGSGKR